MARLPQGTVELIDRALAEDLGRAGDVTSQSLLSDGQTARARIVAREPGILAGIEVAAQVFRRLDSRLRVRVLLADGRRFRTGSRLLEVCGRAQSILAAERTALNFLRHLTGISTVTAAYVAQARGTQAQIYDTRKTTPLLRSLEKYAVTCGGGQNHRMGLFDAVLIKDNHVATACSVSEAVRRARARAPRSLPVQVECDTLAQVREALAAGADLILCDNMGPARLRRVVGEVAGRCPVEASGGITLTRVRAIARSGVDRISVGAITHSAGQVDLALDFAGTGESPGGTARSARKKKSATGRRPRGAKPRPT